MLRTRWNLLTLPALAGLCWIAAGVPASEASFKRIEAEIPMRDGVRLHTEINVPKDARGPLPFLILRTPYSATGQSGTLSSGGYRELASEGYIFVFQDIRGRFRSEGQFVMMRPPRDHSDAKAIDESTDTYDTIEYLLKRVPNNNGRAGVFGVSYPGWLTVMAAIDPHPALRAVSEQASPADMFLGDDFYHNGVFRLSYGFEYSAEMETDRTNYSFPFDRYDTFEWYLHLTPLSAANARWFEHRLPTWNAFEQHPDYDEYWQKLAVPRYVGAPKVPNLNVAGWWDQEDFYGPVKIYETLEAGDGENRNYLVAGPWNHGGWSRGEGRTLGAINFGSDTARYYREQIEAPWFAYWLKGKGDGKFPEMRAFRTGANAWQSYSAWPPRAQTTERKLYTAAHGALSFDAPAESGAEACDSYVSDPAHPIPYRARPIGPTYGRPGWATWLLEDQRFVDLRPDVLSWETAPLAEDLTVTGDIVAHLAASTSGSDADWVVKLIDVYPENYAADPKLGGYQLMVASEVFRARFRKSFEHAVAVTPGAVEDYAVGLHTHDHAFQKGHRIMVQVQSTWFPAFSRNPQKFVPNIFQATEADYQAATQRIFRSREHATYVSLPVLTGAK